ncbi:hypothetical protein I308_102548 [Cryptococcus tetragattii IND107]|uniref:Non-haem dioxygenase N-terminal domain-containing protein n=1 Tax=Cryptococcus tetragattii IND107 TaxID=1296105 RepID=A0ABR3BTT9_9TREE
MSHLKPVTISYSALAFDGKKEDLQQQVFHALGTHKGALGIVLISDLPPQFLYLREKLFRLAHRLANMPEKERAKLEKPETSYMFGWSHGKEIMNGRPDIQKGSYYANPLMDYPIVSDETRLAYPEYYAGNIWPKGMSGLEDFEQTFKELGKLIFDVGVLLARVCDNFVTPTLANPEGTLSSLIAKSKSSKARLLHYYPEDPNLPIDDNMFNDALCGTHLDHSLLTGLCSAMYLDTSDPPQIVPNPPDTTGLWIYPRESYSPVKVSIPEDCLAFQTGEALSLLTSHRLSATPHFVSGRSSSATLLSRETFAFFLQPDVGDVIGENGETFGQFTKQVLGRHYLDGDIKKKNVAQTAVP